MRIPKTTFFLVLLCLVLVPRAGHTAEDCTADNRACLLELIEKESAQIDTLKWKDQTIRELAKTRAFDGQAMEAIALIDKIETPDTKAMTIRGIGMATADRHLQPAEYAEIFKALRAKADSITDPPSYAIALTYIAMAQAFAKDNEGAWKTASDMQNEALRHKAYGETAEIQAENGDAVSAMKSIGFIESETYRNKAYTTVSKILTNGGHYAEALTMLNAITNPYKKAEGIQYLLDTQKPREIPHQ